MEIEKKVLEANTEPLISIVVPIYNIEMYLPRCLDSILAQKYHNIEIMAVDDGSSDRSGEILDEYAKLYPSIRAVHKKNGGVTSARLRGVAEASGEWIGFVDGDDEIEPDMYERLLHNALKYNAEISHCGYQMVFDDGRVNYFHNTSCLVKQDKMTGLKELLDGSRVEPGLWNKLFRKNLLQNVLHSGKMPQDIKINEDLLMNYFLFSQAKLSVFEDVCKYHYIVRKNSASRAKLNEHRIFDPIKVKRIILNQAESEILQFARKAYISTCINVYNELVLEKGYTDEKKVVRKYICDNKEWHNLLSRKQRLLANLVCIIPMLYPFLYGIYARFFQQKRY